MHETKHVERKRKNSGAVKQKREKKKEGGSPPSSLTFFVRNEICRHATRVSSTPSAPCGHHPPSRDIYICFSRSHCPFLTSLEKTEQKVIFFHAARRCGGRHHTFLLWKHIHLVLPFFILHFPDSSCRNRGIRPKHVFRGGLRRRERIVVCCGCSVREMEKKTRDNPP